MDKRGELVLVTGSAGFIGTNLISALLSRGDSVIAIDNFASSEKWKASLFADNSNYEFFEHDIVSELAQVLDKSELLQRFGKIDTIYNLACPASPPRYQNNSIATLKVSTQGVFNVLDTARKYGAKVLHASTSEVYGDPQVHPQPESYLGNVNTVGPRSCYDEGKRVAESICYEYARLYGLDIRMPRFFNTYGPYMDPEDGRVITNFIQQALAGQSLTIYGDGQQTRSFQYVDDLVAAILKLMALPEWEFQPINLGNPTEFTIKQLAELVLDKIPTAPGMTALPAVKDDPKQRRPDITLAMKLLDWEPVIPLAEGLDKTVAYFRERFGSNS